MAQHDLIQVLLPGPSPTTTGDFSGIDELRERARTVRRLFCTCDHAKLEQALPSLIADLRQVADGSSRRKGPGTLSSSPPASAFTLTCSYGRSTQPKP